MSILDNDSFDEYFDSSPSSSPASAECAAAKGRYDSCFFKSYSERIASPFACFPLAYGCHMLEWSGTDGWSGIDAELTSSRVPSRGSTHG